MKIEKPEKNTTIYARSYMKIEEPGKNPTIYARSYMKIDFYFLVVSS